MADHVHVDEKVLAKFAQKLAGNEKKIRDRAVKKLRRWLTARSNRGGFTEEELLKIWKGLHYCMWMADKPLVQEELADTLSRLLNCFSTLEESLTFFDVFLKTESREWFGIDRLRLDKFMMLVRQMYHHILKKLEQNDWPRKYLSAFMDILSSGILHPTDDNVPDGLRFHMVDIYLEELEKLNSGKLIAVESVHMLLETYCVLLPKLGNQILLRHIVKNVFNHLVAKQTKAVFEMEELDSDEEDSDQKISTTVLQVDYAALSERLFELASSESCLARNRNTIYGLVKTFKNLSCGALGDDGYISESEDSLDEMDYEQATQRLKHFDDNLTSHNKKKRKKAMKDQSVKPASKKRRLDSPHRRCFTSERLKKKQEILRSSRLHMENVVQEESVQIKSGKKEKAKEPGKRLKKKKMKNSGNNFTQIRNNVVNNKSVVQKGENIKSAKKSKRKKKKMAVSENATESLNSVSLEDSSADSRKDLTLKCDQKASVEVVDMSVGPESRMLQEKSQETTVIVQDDGLVTNKKFSKLKNGKKKDSGSGVSEPVSDSEINHTSTSVSPKNTSILSESVSSSPRTHKKNSLPEQVSGLSQENGDSSLKELQISKKKKVPTATLR